jgi:hypothetical protein
MKAQDGNVQTVFGGSIKATGFGALTNKFTTIRGRFANMNGVYGGIYLNHKFLIGVSASAVTNNLPVPLEFSVDPTRPMSYEYGQVGMINEYVIGSDKAIHFAFSLFTGSGFTIQYERSHYTSDRFDPLLSRDENWFFVMEPGAQVEVNLLQWMRFCTGVSYRRTFGADGVGFNDNNLSSVAYNVALKFGKF